MIIWFQLLDDVNHFYVTYTVDLLSVIENILFYTLFTLKKAQKTKALMLFLKKTERGCEDVWYEFSSLE